MTEDENKPQDETTEAPQADAPDSLGEPTEADLESTESDADDEDDQDDEADGKSDLTPAAEPETPAV